MTLIFSAHGSNYDVNTALSLLGPENFRASAPQGCLDHLVLIIQNIAVTFLRVLNYICGDHEWYNTRTAFQIVDEYCRSRAIGDALQEEEALDQRMYQLYQSLHLRANGEFSYAEGIDRNLLPASWQQSATLEQHPPSSSIAGAPALTDADDHSAELGSEPTSAVTQPPATVEQPPSLPLVNDVLTSIGADDHSAELGSEPTSVVTEPPATVEQPPSLPLANDVPTSIDTDDHSAELGAEPTSVVTQPSATEQQPFLPLVNDVPTSIGADDHSVEVPSDPIGSLALFKRLPQEMRLAITQYLDPKSIFTMLSCERNSYHLMKNDSTLYRSWLLEVAVQKMEKIADPSQGILQNDYYNSEVFYEYAKAEALIHPEKAFELAKQISDYSKMSDVVCRIAKAKPSHLFPAINEFVVAKMASVNLPPNDKELLSLIKIQAHTDLEQAIINASSCGLRDAAFSEVGKVQIVTNFEQGLATINLITDPLIKHQTICDAIQGRAFTNLEQAEQLLQLVLPVPSHLGIEPVKVLCLIAKALIPSDPERARDLLLEIRDRVSEYDFTKARKCEDMIVEVEALCDTDINKMSRTIDRFLCSPTTYEIVCNIAEMLALTNPALSQELIRRAQRITLSSLSKEEMVIHHCALARAKAFSDQESAKKLFLQALSLAGRTYSGPEYQIKLLGKIVHPLAQTQFPEQTGD